MEPVGPVPNSLPSRIEEDLRTQLQGKLPEADLVSVMSLVHALVVNVQQNYHLTQRSDLYADEAEKLELLVPGFGAKYADALIRGIHHQIEWEKEDQAILREGQKRGMDYGLIVAALLIIGAVVCGVMGAKEVGIALAGASALGMVGKFIDGRRHK